MNKTKKSTAANTARDVALDVLVAVLHRNQPLDETFDRHPLVNKLDSRDRAFARNLAGVVMRHRGQIDAIIAKLLETALPRKAMAVKDILRLGIAQLSFLRTPPHAAVGTAVDLAESRGLEPYKKLVNAVLRRVDREGETLLADIDGEKANTPDWLWQSWTESFGEETARRIAAAVVEEAPLDISTKGDPSLLAGDLEATLLPTGTLRRSSGGNVTALPGFDDGSWWVQDAAAALPARLLGDVAGLRVLDLCAAPGGKTAQLAAAGAQVTALDRSNNRLRRLRENLTRLNLEAEVITADAATWKPEELFDAVLLDAPCSATGTIRRHPDVAWLKKSEDAVKLALLQGRILDNAAKMVKPGGTLVYCTCSLQPEEGPEQIAAFLRVHEAFTRLPITAMEVGGWTEVITESGDLRTLPCHLPEQGGLDGFFASRLVKS